MEPVGVGARNLQERLLLQLDRQNKNESPAYIAVRDHLEDIANNHLPLVAKKMSISMLTLQEVIQEVKSLTPRLGLDEINPHEYIKEEVSIIEEDGAFRAKMVNDNLPNLFISNRYKQLVNDINTPKDVKDYIKEKVRSGVHLINSIIQRQTTILKTVDAIASEQQEFFKFGTKYLKPMTMAHIAQLVGVHETTISRAVSGKYLRCKFGLIPLRQFFSTGYTSENGTAVSNVVVKKAIDALVKKENPFSPLSDSKIAIELKKQGLKVARRTVAKYRESMGILSSNLRRKYPVK